MAKLNLVRRTNHICLDDQQRKGEGSVTVNFPCTVLDLHKYPRVCYIMYQREAIVRCDSVRSSRTATLFPEGGRSVSQINPLFLVRMIALTSPIFRGAQFVYKYAMLHYVF